MKQFKEPIIELQDFELDLQDFELDLIHDLQKWAKLIQMNFIN